MTVQEVISHYNSNKSKVFTVLLDASKAFDRVNYITLFEKLLKRQMCPLVMRLLLQTYLEQNCVLSGMIQYLKPLESQMGYGKGEYYLPFYSVSS